MTEYVNGAAAVLIYYIAAASTMLILRRTIHIPDELFRKILHFILLISYIPFAFAFSTWYRSVLFILVMEAVIYPILALTERLPMFSAKIQQYH